MKKLVTLIFFVVTLCYLQLVLVSSAPPVTNVQQFVEGYALKIPFDNLIKLNQNYEFEIHAYNISNGNPIYTGLSCYMHLYNSTGKHIFEGADSTISHNYDYSFWVDGANFSEYGDYYAVFQCNSSTKGGFQEEFIRVTNANYIIEQEQAILYLGFIALLIFFFIITIMGINKLPAYNNRDEDGNLISINHLKYLRSVLWVIVYGILLAITYLASGLGLAYLPDIAGGKLFFMLFRILYGFALPFVVMWFIYLFVKMYQDRELQRMISRGIMEDNNTI